MLGTSTHTHTYTRARARIPQSQPSELELGVFNLYFQPGLAGAARLGLWDLGLGTGWLLGVMGMCGAVAWSVCNLLLVLIGVGVGVGVLAQARSWHGS